ncbi:hypothetical protein PMIN07_008013 [Paraphaeosphaeria minitans]
MNDFERVRGPSWVTLNKNSDEHNSSHPTNPTIPRYSLGSGSIISDERLPCFPDFMQEVLYRCAQRACMKQKPEIPPQDPVGAIFVVVYVLWSGRHHEASTTPSLKDPMQSRISLYSMHLYAQVLVLVIVHPIETCRTRTC